MKAVSNLSQSELNNLISEASRELEARKKSESVIRDIHKVLDKHGITKRERSVLLQAAMRGGMASTRTPKRASSVKGLRWRPNTDVPPAVTRGPDEEERPLGWSMPVKPINYL